MQRVPLFVLVEECDSALLQQKLQPSEQVISPGERVESVGILQRIEQVFCLCWEHSHRQLHQLV